MARGEATTIMGLDDVFAVYAMPQNSGYRAITPLQGARLYPQ